MKRLLAVTVAGAGALALAPTAPGSPASDERAAAGAARSPKVVCITNYKPARGQYRYRPRRCTFHDRGIFPLAGYNTFTATRMHWRSWGDRRARARGKFIVNMLGPTDAWIRLTKPRSRCGTTVFTKVQIKYRYRVDGETRRDRFRVGIDNCLR